MEDTLTGNFSWAETLKRFNEKGERRSPAQTEQEADTLFLELLEREKKNDANRDPSLRKIPRFFNKKPQNDNIIHVRARQEARTRFLHNKTAEVLDKEDLEQLWFLLKENTSPPQDGTERINYDHFLHVCELLPRRSQQFFQASCFLKFERDEYGRIEIVPFFHYIVRKVNLFQTRIQISLYDSAGYGFLKEKDLENYIFELMPTFPQLHNMQEKFCPFYVISAVRKFFFFLDPKKTGKILIKDLLTSPILAELFELRQERLPIEEANSNWFSLQSSLRVYERYLEIDLDHNGMLSRQELGRFSWGLTDIYIDRIFEEYQTFEGEMDYKSFLDFVLAMENKKSIQSLQYFWKILDVFHKNAIDTFVVNMFLRSVVEKLEARQKLGYRVEDIKDEIWDMAKPDTPHALVFNDLVKSNFGDTIVSILTDARAFYIYDQREASDMEDLEDLDNL